MTRTTRWSAGTAALAAAILVAGWFLLVAPQRSSAATLRTTTATEQAHAAELVGRIAELKAQSEELGSKRALIAAFRTQMPRTADLPGLVRGLTAAAKRAGVELQTVAPAPAQALTPTQTAAAATAAVSSDISAVPVTVTVGGEFAELERFLFELEGLDRAFLVSGLNAQPSSGAGAASSGPALEGPLTLTVQGKVFVNAPAAAATAAAPAATTPTPTPTPSP